MLWSLFSTFFTEQGARLKLTVTNAYVHAPNSSVDTANNNAAYRRPSMMRAIGDISKPSSNPDRQKESKRLQALMGCCILHCVVIATSN